MIFCVISRCSWPAATRALTLLLGLACFGAAQRVLAAEVTLDSLLQELTDFSAVARWPAPAYTTHQSSSYDRTEVAPDQPGWFANNDFSQYVREETHAGRTEKVMLDVAGPGAIVRFWLTTVQNKKGTLRIYLDGSAEPVLTFPAYDLLTGDLKLGAPLAQPHPGYSPNNNGGDTLMLPIPYAKHCKVTWEEAGEGPRYYQIDYRTYAPGTAVETFTPGILARARPLIEATGKRLLAPPDASGGRVISLNRVVPAGESTTLDLPAGPAAIRRLELALNAGATTLTDQQLRSVIIKIAFDGNETVWCPAPDFFGSGAGLNPLQSWYRTVTTDGRMICRWVMPYAKTARVTVSNLGPAAVAVALSAGTGPWHWDARSMYFHSTWHYDGDLQTPPVRDWEAIHLTGRGVYVGDTLSLFNYIPTWYGEGDEKIRVDGEALPSFLGTGMEDYYDYSFAPRGLMQTPFANQVRVDQRMTQGHNIMTRTRNLDGIPFSHSLDFVFELISWKPTRLIYAMTTYWYAFPGTTADVRPQPDAATRPVPTLAEAAAAAAPKHWPGAIECEKLRVHGKSGDFSVREQDMEPFDVTRWSGGAQLLGVPQGVGDFVELEVPVIAGETRDWQLYATQAPDYGKLRFFVDGRELPMEFDGYAPDVRPAPPLDLGAVTAATNVCILRVQVMGANPKVAGDKHLFGLDCLKLIKP